MVNKLGHFSSSNVDIRHWLWKMNYNFVILFVLQVKSICRDYGVVCIRREGQDVEKTISDDQILNENQVHRLSSLLYLSICV